MQIVNKNAIGSNASEQEAAKVADKKDSTK